MHLSAEKWKMLAGYLHAAQLTRRCAPEICKKVVGSNRPVLASLPPCEFCKQAKNLKIPAYFL